MQRYNTIDWLRGLTVIHMVIYHTLYSLHAFYGFSLAPQLYYYQQFICWSFILLSGFSLSFSRHLRRKILLLTGISLLITTVSALFVPQEAIYFGVIHFFALATLCFALLRKWIERIPPQFALVLSFLLFLVTKSLPEGTMFFSCISLPAVLYRTNLFFLGLPSDSFTSADYFPLIPWFFLFLTGFYLHYFISLQKKEASRNMIPILGRHSLFIYLLHQPVILAVLYLIFR